MKNEIINNEVLELKAQPKIEPVSGPINRKRWAAARYLVASLTFAGGLQLTTLFGHNKPSEVSAQVVGECQEIWDSEGNSNFLYYRGNGIFIECTPDQYPTATPTSVPEVPTPTPEATATPVTPEATPIPTALPTQIPNTPQPSISGECIVINSEHVNLCNRQVAPPVLVAPLNSQPFHDSHDRTTTHNNNLPRAYAEVNNSGNSRAENCVGVGNCSPSAAAYGGHSVVIIQGEQPAPAPTRRPGSTAQTEPRVPGPTSRPPATFQPRPSMP